MSRTKAYSGKPCAVQPQLAPFAAQAEPALPSRPWQAICELDAIPQQAGIGARLGERQIALFRFGDQVYALDNLEPGSEANVLSRGLLGDAGGEPIVISPLYKQRIRLRDDTPVRRRRTGGTRLVPVKVENGKVWVGNQQLLARAEAS